MHAHYALYPTSHTYCSKHTLNPPTKKTQVLTKMSPAYNTLHHSQTPYACTNICNLHSSRNTYACMSFVVRMIRFGSCDTFTAFCANKSVNDVTLFIALLPVRPKPRAYAAQILLLHASTRQKRCRKFYGGLVVPLGGSITRTTHVAALRR